MSSLERAVEIAAQAHAGQKDKGGAVYLLHPLRVMLRLDDATATEAERIVAILHDVIEDSDDWTSDRLLKEGFSKEVVRALESVTKRPDEDYMTFVRRAGNDVIGKKVKLADLRDNLRELPNHTPGDRARRKKYEDAIKELEATGCP